MNPYLIIGISIVLAIAILASFLYAHSLIQPLPNVPDLGPLEAKIATLQTQIDTLQASSTAEDTKIETFASTWNANFAPALAKMEDLNTLLQQYVTSLGTKG